MATKKFKGQKVDAALFVGPSADSVMSNLPSAPNPNREYVLGAELIFLNLINIGLRVM